MTLSFQKLISMKNKGKLLQTILLILLPTLTFAQKLPDQKINNRDKQELIEAAGKVLVNHYLYQDTAILMQELLSNNLQSGKYTDIQTARAFAKTITNDLRNNFRDRHIALNYAPKLAKAIQNGQESGDGVSEEYIQKLLRIEIYENFRIPEVKRLNGNVGYLKIDQLLPPALATGYSEKFAAAVELIADTDALIVDLRDNVGGYAGGVEFVLSYFFQPHTHYANGFVRTENGLKINKDYTIEDLSGRRLLNQNVYVLVSSKTGSGAEAIAHTLKYSERAKLIGETTFGAGYAYDEFPIGKFVMDVPNAASMHPNATVNWESIGVKPHIIISPKKAFDTAYKLAINELLQQELTKPKTEQYQYRLDHLQWEVDRINDLENQFKLSVEQTKKFIGRFGNRTITAEGSQLFYQRINPNRPKRKLIPVKPNEFLIEGLDQYRIKFEQDKKTGQVTLLKFYSKTRLYIDKKEKQI